MSGSARDAGAPDDGVWTRRIEQLEAEVDGLRRSLRTRGVIEQAKGVLAERLGIDGEEAFARLAGMSQETNVRVVDVAANVLAQRGAARSGGPADDPAPAEHAREARAVLAGVERLGEFAWAEWDKALEPLSSSPRLHRMLGREPNGVPISWRTLLTAVAAPDRAELESGIRRTLERGVESCVEVRLRGDGTQPRVVRVVSVRRPRRGDGGAAVLTIIQDLTDPRRRDEELARTTDRLAGQRLQFALERSQTQQLRSVLFPSALTQIGHAGVTVTARHAAPSPIHRFRGDFYDVSRVDEVLSIVVGDVFGSGVPAAGTMIRLRHGARSLALAGLGPAAILQTLNRELCRDTEPPLASLVAAQLSADGRQLRWAQAGHFSPLLVRNGRGRSLRRAKGDALGLFADATFAETATRLVAGDLLVLYTDGVLNREDFYGDPVRRLAETLRAAYRPGNVGGLMHVLQQPAGDEACLVTLECGGAGSP